MFFSSRFLYHGKEGKKEQSSPLWKGAGRFNQKASIIQHRREDMKYQDFLGQVHEKAHLAALEEAVTASRAALSVLAQRLTAGQRSDLAAQLPEEIGSYLTVEGESERFDLDAYYQRVSEEEGVDLPDAVHHAQAVMAVVQDAVTRGEMEDVLSQLPDEFAPLFAGETLQEG
jgi:uncharacterized protein (DUF2267 family)